jgi:hypothetical protein
MLNVSSTRSSGGISPESLVSFVRDLLGGNPNPDDTEPPGPWGPIIHAALERMMRFSPLPDPWLAMAPHAEPWQSVFGRHPIPWHRGVGPDPVLWSPASLIHIITRRHPELWDLFGGNPLSRVALNPQPLPPRIVFAAALADELIAQASSAAQLAGWVSQEGEEHGIIIVGGHVLRYVDEICGNDIKFRFPRPVPPPWWSEELHATDLMAMGVRFEMAAATGEALANSFAQAGERLIQAGLEKMN